MTAPFKILFLLWVALCFTGCAQDDPEATEMTSDDEVVIVEEALEAEVQTDIQYGADPNEVYDLYLPAGRLSSETKVLLLIHGGGWTDGDKEDMNEFIPLIQFNHPNHAIVNINYTLASTSNGPAFPQQFEAVGQAISYIVARSEELQLLPEFGIIGVSAGAHIGLMYDAVYDTQDQVKFVCDIVGPTDFTDPFYADQPNFDLYLDALTDESAYPDGSIIAEVVSPRYQISPQSSPALLFYGNQDPLVPLTNGESLNAAYTNATVTHNFTVYDGGHGDWDEESAADLQSQLNLFIETYLPIQ